MAFVRRAGAGKARNRGRAGGVREVLARGLEAVVPSSR